MDVIFLITTPWASRFHGTNRNPPGDLVGEGRLLKCDLLAVFPALRAFGLHLLAAFFSFPLPFP